MSINRILSGPVLAVQISLTSLLVATSVFAAKPVLNCAGYLENTPDRVQELISQIDKNAIKKHAYSFIRNDPPGGRFFSFTSGRSVVRDEGYFRVDYQDEWAIAILAQHFGYNPNNVADSYYSEMQRYYNSGDVLDQQPFYGTVNTQARIWVVRQLFYKMARNAEYSTETRNAKNFLAYLVRGIQPTRR